MNKETITKTNCDFNEELEKSMEINEEYDVNEWIYVPCEYKNYRYILGTKGENPLICIGINPSTAKPNELDNTLKSVKRIALNNGYDSFIMFNVYPHRATDPNNMENCCNDFLHWQNMKAFEYILKNSKEENPSLWAAWGTIIEKREYLFDCLNDMVDIGLKHNALWYIAGKRSKKGHPHHPLYLRKDSVLEEINIKDYLNGSQ